ncbi:Oidioi.mRNA.OKI2018_I69.chr1.g2258.t1.cds [Oikopleura dioica]|uniref:Oidioi.mRNA.OKI2018_I69.chr1.g2258.t1.cds n=1 Tax=Oikopleura dioica TaxID=34765 RepID=A0ABN7SXI1_OIKDI|nr:Oidioi.mRNA.OKI2018_I69.chr1.g2258.t1.cds [Oikopleura dioica]
MVILKTEFKGDRRNIPLANEQLTFDDLLLMLCRIYSADIGDDDVVKYLDSENDWITMNDTNDLSFAIQLAQDDGRKFLKIKVGGGSSDVPEDVLADLRSIRDGAIGLIGTCNKYLRKYRLTGANSSKSSASESLPVVAPESVPKQEVAEQSSVLESTPQPEPEKPEVSEFDPYNQTSVDRPSSQASFAPSTASSFQQQQQQAPPTPQAPTAQVPEPTPVQAEVPAPVPVAPSQSTLESSFADTSSAQSFEPTPAQTNSNPYAAFNSSANSSSAPSPFPGGDNQNSLHGQPQASSQASAFPPSQVQQIPQSVVAPPKAQPVENQAKPPQAAPTPVQPPASGAGAYFYGQEAAKQQTPVSQQQQQPPAVSQQQQLYQQQQQAYQQQYQQYYAQQQQQQQQQQQNGYPQASQAQQQPNMGYQQQYAAPQASAGPPPSAAPPSGPPMGAPAGGYRLNRGSRNVRPGYPQ